MRGDPYSYSYNLPPELIARRPAAPRDRARLFVYDTATDEIALDRFLNLDRHLPPGALLVMNDTKVVPARSELHKMSTGGKVEVLFLINEWKGSGPVPAIADRKIAVGAELRLGKDRLFTAIGQDENIFYLQPRFPARKLLGALRAHGVTPVPKYIKGISMSEAELRQRYQTVFAKHAGSVAAPTASLHFTDRVFQRLTRAGIRRAFITLDVGLGTFAPLRAENIASGTLHTESLAIPAATSRLVREYKKARHPIVAVGTTVMRTLESEAEKILHGNKGVKNSGASKPIIGTTQIFIRPPYRFKIADAMITNFHLPGTSLMMLVQALLAHKGARRSLADLYQIAIREKFRFYSFGDAMLIT